MSEGAFPGPSDGTAVPIAKEGKSDEVFEVEKILAHKVSGKNFLLKVRWMGYGPDEDTWEPEADIKECAGEVVKEYYNKMKVNDKTELIGDLQRNMSRNKSQAKKRKIENDDDSAGSGSDTSFDVPDGSSKKAKKKRSNTHEASSSSRSSKVPTKAALKSYDAHSSTPNNAKKAAFVVRDQRNDWLADSSDDEPGAPVETEIEKLANKVKEKVVKEGLLSPKTAPPSIPVERSASPSQQPCSSLSLTHSTAPTTPSTSSSASVKKRDEVKEEPGSVPRASEEKDDADTEWTVDGIVRHVTEQNKRVKLILMTNAKTGVRKVLESREAFDLDGWALAKYLLDRCEF